MTEDTGPPYRLCVKREKLSEVKAARAEGCFFGPVVIEDNGHPEFIIIESELIEDQSAAILMFC